MLASIADTRRGKRNESCIDFYRICMGYRYRNLFDCRIVSGCHKQVEGKEEMILDVLLGALIGNVIGQIIVHLWQRNRRRREEMGDLDRAITLLKKEYKKIQGTDDVDSPILYALYHTMIEFEAEDHNRRIKEREGQSAKNN